MKKPIDRRTQEVVEPAHKFEINLEPDNFTEEKCVRPLRMLWSLQTKMYTDMPYSQITKKTPMAKVTRIFQGSVSKGFYAPG